MRRRSLFSGLFAVTIAGFVPKVKAEQPVKFTQRNLKDGQPLHQIAAGVPYITWALNSATEEGFSLITQWAPTLSLETKDVSAVALGEFWKHFNAMLSQEQASEVEWRIPPTLEWGKTLERPNKWGALFAYSYPEDADIVTVRARYAITKRSNG